MPRIVEPACELTPLNYVQIKPLHYVQHAVDPEQQHRQRQEQRQRRRRKRQEIIAGGLGLAGLLAGAVLLIESSSKLGAAIEGSKDDSQGNLKDVSMAEFSTLSPVLTGMEEVLRLNETWPLPVWGAGRAGPESTLSSTGGFSSGSSALPTNEWWENMAMGPSGDTEYDAANFVNALPYHIDVSQCAAEGGSGCAGGFGEGRRGVRVMVPEVTTAKVQNRFCQVVDCSSVSMNRFSPMMLPIGSLLTCLSIYPTAFLSFLRRRTISLVKTRCYRRTMLS